MIWDNERGIGRGRHRSEGVPAFMGTLATRLVLLPPRDPESKGVVERRNGWFETSFMPGRGFASPADFNDEFTDWLDTANSRTVRTVGAKPVDRLEVDKQAMLAHSPPVPPVVGWHTRSGWAATTTCGSPATTTRSTRPRSAGWSTPAPTWSRSRCEPLWVS